MIAMGKVQAMHEFPFEMYDERWWLFHDLVIELMILIWL